MSAALPSGPQSSRGAILPAIAAAFLSIAAAFVAIHPQNARGEVGVVFPPWADEADIHNAIIAAGGRAVGPSRLANVFVAYAPDAEFHQAIRAQGAWFSVAATGLCAPLVQSSGRGGRL